MLITILIKLTSVRLQLVCIVTYVRRLSSFFHSKILSRYTVYVCDVRGSLVFGAPLFEDRKFRQRVTVKWGGTPLE